MSNKILECINITKKIGHHTIVKNVNINLYEGDILGFIGPNGAGKTTTIKLLLGLQPLTSGSVTIANYNLKNNFTKAIKNVGAIIENPDLYMYLTGYNNLKIAANIYNISKSRIEEVVKLVGLSDSINKQVKKYSLGMRQRLGIAQAILHKPRILILDEPMNGLDPIGIKELKDLITYLAKKEHIAIIISSHILSELENLCTRICIMNKGTIIKDTTPKKLKNELNQNSYILEVSKTNLDHIIYNYEVIDDKHIKIYTTKNNITNIIKALILNNIDIYEIKKELLTLENIFIDITKDNNAKIN